MQVFNTPAERKPSQVNLSSDLHLTASAAQILPNSKSNSYLIRAAIAPTNFHFHLEFYLLFEDKGQEIQKCFLRSLNSTGHGRGY